VGSGEHPVGEFTLFVAADESEKTRIVGWFFEDLPAEMYDCARVFGMSWDRLKTLTREVWANGTDPFDAEPRLLLKLNGGSMFYVWRIPDRVRDALAAIEVESVEGALRAAFASEAFSPADPEMPGQMLEDWVSEVCDLVQLSRRAATGHIPLLGIVDSIC
jgi:hypothetical protein